MSVVLGYQTSLFSVLSRFNLGSVSCAASECRDVHNANEDII